MQKLNISKEWLIEQHRCMEKTIPDIAKELGCSRSAIFSYFKKYGIEVIRYNSNIIEKRKKTCLERYGVESTSKLTEVKNKIKETCLERYGVEWTTQTEQMKIKSQKTVLEKYGVENVFQNDDVKNKIKNTLIDRYGVDHSSNIPENREKFKKTCMERYGAESPLQCPEILEKVKNTTLSKYGVERYSQLDECKDKIRQTSLKKYGVEHYSKTDKCKKEKIQTCLSKYGTSHEKQKHLSLNSLDKLNNSNWLREQHQVLNKTHVQIAEELNVSPSCVDRAMKKFEIVTVNIFHSDLEKEVLNFVRSLSDQKIESNVRSVIPPLEIDIFVPDKKLAIEFDGLYWHSYNKKETAQEKNKHCYKTNLCDQRGIQLLHIFENEWKNKGDIVRSIIKTKLGFIENKIGARKCTVKEITDSIMVSNFLNENHIQGYCPSKINLGLYHLEELVSVMTFNRPRYNKNYEWELIRFCSKLNMQIVGGAGKLFNYFLQNYKPNSIISYADRRYFSGSLYKNLGFVYKRTTSPNYFYTNDYENLTSRIHFQKHKLPNLLKKFNDKLTESQNMFNNGYHRIWDSGNLVYVYNRSI